MVTKPEVEAHLSSQGSTALPQGSVVVAAGVTSTLGAVTVDMVAMDGDMVATGTATIKGHHVGHMLEEEVMAVAVVHGLDVGIARTRA